MVGTKSVRLHEYTALGSKMLHVREEFFKHLLLRFIEEQRVPVYILIAAFTLQYFILTIVPLEYFRYEPVLLSVVVGWLLLTIGFSAFATRISIYMTIAFTYIVYPMMVWGLTAKLTSVLQKGASDWSGLLVALHSIVLTVSLAVIILVTLIGNNIPSRSPQAYMSRSSFVSSVLCITLGHLLSAFSAGSSSVAAKALISVCESGLLIFNIYNSVVRPIFWKAILNKVYCIGLVYHLTCRVILQITMIDRLRGQGWWGSIFVFLIIKYFVAVWTRIDHRDPFIKSKGLNSRLYSGLRMALSMARPISEPDYQTLLYMGIWSAYSEDLEDRSLENLHDFLAEHFESSMGTNRTTGVAQLKLQMLRKRLGLKDLRLVVQKLLKEKERHSFLSQFDCYFYQKIFESKIKASHRFRSRDANGEIEPTTDVFDYLNEYLIQNFAETDISSFGSNHAYAIQQLEQNAYLNLERPFKDMDMYNEAIKYITLELEKKEQLYRKLEIDVKVKSSDLYRLNSDTLDTKKKVGRIYKAFNFEQVDRSSYTYPLFMYYFGNVRNKISTSEEIFTMYKNKLNRIYRHKYRFQDTSKGAEGIEANSATLQVSLSEKRVGVILNASVNYFEFLGHPKSGKIDDGDKNINNMLPHELSQKHLEAMTNLSKIDELNTHARDLFIIGFDDFLRQTKVVIRVCPNIQQSLTALVRLSFNTRSTTSVVLVNRDLKIISADEKFWNFFDKFETQREFTNINQLSKQVASAVTILNIAKQIQSRGYKLSNTENRTDQHQGPETLNDLASTVGGVNNKMAKKHSLTGELLKMYQCLQEFTTMNASIGVKYAVDPESMYANYISEDGFACSIETGTVMQVEVTRMYMRFEEVEEGRRPSTRLHNHYDPKSRHHIRPPKENSENSSFSRRQMEADGKERSSGFGSKNVLNKMERAMDAQRTFEDVLSTAIGYVGELAVGGILTSGLGGLLLCGSGRPNTEPQDSVIDVQPMSRFSKVPESEPVNRGLTITETEQIDARMTSRQNQPDGSSTTKHSKARREVGTLFSLPGRESPSTPTGKQKFSIKPSLLPKGNKMIAAAIEDMDLLEDCPSLRPDSKKMRIVIEPLADEMEQEHSPQPSNITLPFDSVVSERTVRTIHGGRPNVVATQQVSQMGCVFGDIMSLDFEIRMLIDDYKFVLYELSKCTHTEGSKLPASSKNKSPNPHLKSNSKSNSPADDSSINKNEHFSKSIMWKYTGVFEQQRDSPIDERQEYETEQLTMKRTNNSSSVRKRKMNIASRETNREVQYRLRSRNNIVVASSNLIGKILNKVMVGID